MSDRKLNQKVNLADFKVSRPVKVKAFSTCEQIDDKLYEITGAVTFTEANMLESILRLARREVGSLEPDELNAVTALLILQGKK